MGMDIEGILTDRSTELLDIDLSALEEELATGDYDAQYVVRCREKIQEIRGTRAQAILLAKTEQRNDRPGVSPLDENGVILRADELSPFGKPIKRQDLSDAEAFERRLELIRQADKPTAALREYLQESDLDEMFIAAHLSSFTAAERSVLLDCFDFSEDFLEQYFNVFDADDIAKRQHFSEGFFMRHFDDLDASAVLQRGVNEWRSMDARSQKLDVFLRLKGVRI